MIRRIRGGKTHSSCILPSTSQALLTLPGPPLFLWPSCGSFFLLPFFSPIPIKMLNWVFAGNTCVFQDNTMVLRMVTTLRPADRKELVRWSRHLWSWRDPFPWIVRGRSQNCEERVFFFFLIESFHLWWNFGEICLWKCMHNCLWK